MARARAGGEDLEVAEQRVRGRLVTRLAEELVRLQAPVVLELGASRDDLKGLRYLAGGRRAGTLRRRLGDWVRVARWLSTQVFEGQYPTVSAFILYLEARASEPCGPTVLRSAVEALRYMECLGKIPADVQVSGAQIVMAAAREVTSELESPRLKPSDLGPSGGSIPGA